MAVSFHFSLIPLPIPLKDLLCFFLFIFCDETTYLAHSASRNGIHCDDFPNVDGTTSLAGWDPLVLPSFSPFSSLPPPSFYMMSSLLLRTVPLPSLPVILHILVQVPPYTTATQSYNTPEAPAHFNYNNAYKNRQYGIWLKVFLLLPRLTHPLCHSFSLPLISPLINCEFRVEHSMSETLF